MTPEQTDYVNDTAEALSDALIDCCHKQGHEPVMALNIAVSNVMMLAIKLRRSDVDPRDAMRYAAKLVGGTVDTTVAAMEADPEMLKAVMQQHRERREAMGDDGMDADMEDFPEIAGRA